MSSSNVVEQAFLYEFYIKGCEKTNLALKE